MTLQDNRKDDSHSSHFRHLNGNGLPKFFLRIIKIPSSQNRPFIVPNEHILDVLEIFCSQLIIRVMKGWNGRFLVKE